MCWIVSACVQMLCMSWLVCTESVHCRHTQDREQALAGAAALVLLVHIVPRPLLA